MKTSNCFLAQQPGADELYDIAILTPKDSIWPIILWSLLSLVLLIGALTLAISVIRSRKPVASSLSPKEKAVARLRLVQRHSNELNTNEIMLEVSDSLKDYLAEQYNDPLRYETTQEFLTRILKEKTQLPIAAQEELRGFIVAADEVKFGRTPDSHQKCLPMIKVAKDIVNLCETSDHQRDSNRRLITQRE